MRGGIAFAYHSERTPHHGGAGGQQSSVRGRLLRGSTVSGSLEWGPLLPFLVGWSVFDRRAAPVARGLGGYLGGCRVAGLGRVVVVLSIKRPKRAHTRGRI